MAPTSRTLFLTAFAALACASIFPQQQLLQQAQARSLRPTPYSSSTASLFAASATANEHDGTADDHAYFRPPREETGGSPGNTRKYHRAPCPCLNTLANHGYFPRDGKNISVKLVKSVLVEVFNVHPSLVDMLISPLPPVFSLAELGKHNFLEHDASLVHDDAYFGRDPSLVNTTLADELFARAGKDQVLTKRILAHHRADRERECKKDDPEYSLSLKLQTTTYAEAAVLLLVMGDYESETISVEAARSFLVHEKIPDGFKKSNTAITTTTALYLAAQIKFLASLPWLVAETE